MYDPQLMNLYRNSRVQIKIRLSLVYRRTKFGRQYSVKQTLDSNCRGMVRILIAFRMIGLGVTIERDEPDEHYESFKFQVSLL